MRASFPLVLCLFVALAAVKFGCEGVAEQIESIEPTAHEIGETGDQIAPALDPATGGAASVVWGAIGTIVGGVFAINRAILARKRGHAIKSIDRRPDTPRARDQVDDPDDVKTISQVTG